MKIQNTINVSIKSKFIKLIPYYDVQYGVVLRIIVMNIANTIVYLVVLGLPISGLVDWLVFVSIMNPIQSIWDLLIPYAIVFGVMGYGLKLDEKFEIW